MELADSGIVMVDGKFWDDSLEQDRSWDAPKPHFQSDPLKIPKNPEINTPSTIKNIPYF